MEEKKEEIKKESSKNKVSKNVMKKYILAIAIVVLIVIVDQVFKIYAINHFKDNSNTVTSVIGLTYKENYKGAFGVKFNSKAMYTISTGVVLVLVASFIKQQAERLNKLTIGVLAIICAGGLSNLIDKLIHGYVIGYLVINKFKIPVTSIGEVLMIISWVILAAIFAKTTYKDIKESKELKAKKIADKLKNKNNENKENKQ